DLAADHAVTAEEGIEVGLEAVVRGGGLLGDGAPAAAAGQEVVGGQAGVFELRQGVLDLGQRERLLAAREPAGDVGGEPGAAVLEEGENGLDAVADCGGWGVIWSSGLDELQATVPGAAPFERAAAGE